MGVATGEGSPAILIITDDTVCTLCYVWISVNITSESLQYYQGIHMHCIV